MTLFPDKNHPRGNSPRFDNHKTPGSVRPTVSWAFTIIELLVVVSIITLLIAILLPAVGKAKAQANLVACGTSIRGLDQGLIAYTTSWDMCGPMNGILFPKSGGKNVSPTIGYGHGDTNMQDWDLPYGCLWEYVNQNRAAYLCKQDVADGLIRVGTKDPTTGNPTNIPLARSPNWSALTGTISVAPSNLGYWSYSVNSILNSEGQVRNNFLPHGASATTQQPWIDPLKWTTIIQPAEFITFVEEDPNSPFNDEVFDAPAYNGGDKLSGRHQNTGNVAFADGHVEPFSDVLFNNGPSAGGPANQDNYTAMQYPITREFFPDLGQFAAPPPSGP